MMGDVVDLPVITKLDLQPKRVLAKALDHDLQGVVVLGWDEDGDFYFAGSYASGPETLWLLEFAKKRLMEIGDPEKETT